MKRWLMTKVAKWNRDGAEKGDAESQFDLGNIYANGEGVPQNYAEAVKWFRKAAEQGHAKARGRLGLSYLLGEGVPEDDVQAYAWFNIAAAQGVKVEATRDSVIERLTGKERDCAQKLAQEYWEAYVVPFR